MTEEQGWIVIGLITFGLFKPRLAMHWYYARKRFFWHTRDRILRRRR